MDKTITLILLGTFTILIPATLILTLWIVTKLRKVSDRPLSPNSDGSINVPVRCLKRRYRFFGYSENSLSPRLEIARDGLRFKVFKTAHWPFGEIVKFDFFPIPFITRMEIRTRSDGRLYIDVADKAHARDFMRALPRSLPFTDRAIRLRDDLG